MANNLPFYTTWPGTMQSVIPSYLFEEYSDDEDLQAFVATYNLLAQQYIDWFNQISLPIYTGPLIVGTLLDWVGQGLYGIRRPTLVTGTVNGIGPLNTYAYNVLALNSNRSLSNQVYYPATDDIYKRVITWQHYKGDGFYFNVTWLKRRVMRFIAGANGTDPLTTNDLRDISVTSSNGAFTIRIRNSATYGGAPAFAACIAGQVLNLPFQYTYTAVLV